MPEKEWKYASVDLSTDSTTVEPAPCLVKGAIVTTALSAHACPIKDSTTSVCAFPPSAAVGDTIDLEGVRFETSLVVDPDDAAAGVITVFYRLLREP